MRRAVRETKQLLEEAGHTVRDNGCPLLGQGDKPIPYLLTQQLLLKGKTLFSRKDGGFPVGLSGNPRPASRPQWLLPSSACATDTLLHCPSSWCPLNSQMWST